MNTEEKVSQKFVEACGIRWHYVEAGMGEAVVFLHGLPESWFSWHHQIEEVSKGYHAIGVDLKGYGQSDKKEGDYSRKNVAKELICLFDVIGLNRFSLVTHDWGTLIGDFVASSAPERIIKYIRMQCPLVKRDPSNHPQFVVFRDQELAKRIMADAKTFVSAVYEGGSLGTTDSESPESKLRTFKRTRQKIDPKDMEGIITEFSRPGVAEAVPRYFRDIEREDREEVLDKFRRMTFPVLLLQGEYDPAMPLWYYDDFDRILPNAKLQIVRDAGHFTELEKPDDVSKAILDFLAE